MQAGAASLIIALMGAAASESAGPATAPAGAGQGRPAVRIQPDGARAGIPFLSWDTEDGRRADRNLLREGAGVVLRWRAGDRWHSSAEFPARIEDAETGRKSYRLTPTAETHLAWSIAPLEAELRMRITGRGGNIENLELLFPFDPGATPTTILPTRWEADGTCRLPAVVSAPDFGQMRVSCKETPDLSARLEGDRHGKVVDFRIAFPVAAGGFEYTLDFVPVHLPPPKGLKDEAIWRQVRRGWFGALQPTARWGEQGRPFSAPPGVLGNNVLSDPASPSVWFYADQALWTPEVAPGISAAALVRQTVEYWLDRQTRPTGEVVGYWAYGNFLDANAGPVIAAWDYVEATGDVAWLGRRIERLEFIAEFLARRDVDDDGMIEAVQSGNRGTLQQPNRSCAWWDALNCGHKDGYTNAIIYRAWRCLADLEGRLGRGEKQARYTRLADRLKAAYAKTLFNPGTGWLAWWRSADGELHDYASPVVNGMAIEYGLVPPEQGREILRRLHEKLREARFTRFDLGVPPMLVPVLRADYLLPDAIGCPKREDGADTFGQYMNGGITAGQVLHFLAAHYVVGMPEEGDRILRAMIDRQSNGGFQNGVRDAAMQGIDWTTWDGKPSGYEGYLADSFRFLQAAMLREKAFRDRYYRPLTQE